MSKLTIFENTGFRGEKSKIQGGKKKNKKTYPMGWAELVNFVKLSLAKCLVVEAALASEKTL